MHAKVRVVGFSKDISESAFLSYLRKQNPDLFLQSSVVKLIRFWPTHSNINIFQANLEVDSVTYDILLKSGHVLIGLNPCSVYDTVIVQRCYKCNGYFHGSKSCKNQVSCPLCAARLLKTVLFIRATRAAERLLIRNAALTVNRCKMVQRILP